MGSLFGLLNIASQGIAAQTAEIDTTGKNVSNATTAGYVRKTAVLEGNQSDGGVQFTGVSRSFDQFTFASVVLEHGKAGAASSRNDALAQLQAVVAPDSGGIADNINSFMSSLQTLVGNPSDPSTRATVLANAQSLAESISQTANGIQTTQSDMLTKAQGVATTLNQDLSQIATLNGQIASATANGGDASDLEDQRDQLVTTVADNIGAKTITDSSGQVTLFAAGTTLVNGSTASSIAVGTDASGNMQVTATRPDGSSVDVTSNVNDGALGGLREARDTDAAGTLNQLDQFAYDLSNAANSIQSTGYGTDGTTGTNLFVAPTTVAGAARNMALDPAIIGNPQKIATSSTAAGLPSGNDVALKLAALSSTSLGSEGTPTNAFASITSAVGNAKQSADNENTLRTSTVAQAETLNSSSSGVSLDEEMANLTQYQNAFAASSKVLTTAAELLQTLISSIATV
jgi:flagellar hook-associated protein 1 FlgK